MSSSSPATSISDASAPPTSPHSHHPPYERLILRLFRSAPPGKPLHLTSIRTQFAKLYTDRYWFPPSWPRHLYQRLRELERREIVLCEGPHSLYFRLAPSAGIMKKRRSKKVKPAKAINRRKGKELKKAERVAQKAAKLPKPQRPKSKTSARLTELTPPTSDISKNLPILEHLQSIEQCLKSFQPWEEVDRLEIRLASQLQIVQSLLNAYQAGNLDVVQEIQTQLDDLLLQQQTGLNLEESIQNFKTLLERLNTDYSMNRSMAEFEPGLTEAIERLQHVMEMAGKMQQIDLGDSLATLSSLLLALLNTVQMLRNDNAAHEDHEGHLNTLITSLEQDLSRREAIHKIATEEEEVCKKELEIVKNTEQLVGNVTDTMASLTSQLDEQKSLILDERSHYESLISALQAQLEEESCIRAQEVEEASRQRDEALQAVKQEVSRTRNLQKELANLRLSSDKLTGELSSQVELVTMALQKVQVRLEEYEGLGKMIVGAEDTLAQHIAQMQGIIKVARNLTQ